MADKTVQFSFTTELDFDKEYNIKVQLCRNEEERSEEKKKTPEKNIVNISSDEYNSLVELLEGRSDDPEKLEEQVREEIEEQVILMRAAGVSEDIIKDTENDMWRDFKSAIGKFKAGYKISEVEPEQSSKQAEKDSKPKRKTKNAKDMHDFASKKGLIDISKLEKKVLNCIIGQDPQVKKIITALYRAKCFNSIKSNILIIGNSGTGKTETICQIAKNLGIPYTIEDATKYTQEGYVGANTEDMVYNLIDAADGDFKKAENGIIIVDEIDKKAGNDNRDVAGNVVLKSLLKIIEGTEMYISNNDFLDSETIKFDTHKIIVIFMGAFPEMAMIREKRLNKKKLGFNISNSDNEKDINESYTKQDLIDYGLPEEFVGRIDTIVEMKDLNKMDLVNILSKSKLSIFRKYEEELKAQGIKLEYDNKLLEEIAEKSIELKTGARELSVTVNYIFENIIYEIFQNFGKYSKCTLKEGIVKDNSKFILS